MPISEYEGEFARPAPQPQVPDDRSAGPVELQQQAPLVAPAFQPMFAAPAPAPASVAATSLRRRAGLGFLLAVGAGGAGVALGGPWGGAAGVLLLGALRNGLRARRLWSTVDRQEATRSGTMAVLGIGSGGYLAYRAYQSRNRTDE